jgi:aspartate racemase
MKTIGICIPTIEGGVICHQEIGREAMRRGIAYPQIVTHSPLYAQGRKAVKTGDFLSLAVILSDSVNRTAKAGAEFAIIPCNTPHIAFDQVASQSVIPVLSILEVSADYCVKHGYKRVGILGTSTTVRHRIYDEPLRKRGITAVYASDPDQDFVYAAIENELIPGIFIDKTLKELVRVAQDLGSKCDAIILGCTELPLVLTEENCGFKVVDTTRNLAHAALDFAIKE